jgi:hypothetical protein
VDAIEEIAPATWTLTPKADGGVDAIALDRIKLYIPIDVCGMTFYESCLNIYPINFLMKWNFYSLLNLKIDKLIKG